VNVLPWHIPGLTSLTDYGTTKQCVWYFRSNVWKMQMKFRWFVSISRIFVPPYAYTMCLRRKGAARIWWKLCEFLTNFENFSLLERVWNLLQMCTVFAITPEVCCCTILGSQKFEFVANREENSNKMLWCLHICILLNFACLLIINLVTTSVCDSC